MLELVRFWAAAAVYDDDVISPDDCFDVIIESRIVQICFKLIYRP